MATALRLENNLFEKSNIKNAQYVSIIPELTHFPTLQVVYSIKWKSLTWDIYLGPGWRALVR